MVSRRLPASTRLSSLFDSHSHDSAGSVDAALESSAEGIHALKISLVVLLITAMAQSIVVVLTGSTALLADGSLIHNPLRTWAS